LYPQYFYAEDAFHAITYAFSSYCFPLVVIVSDLISHRLLIKWQKYNVSLRRDPFRKLKWRRMAWPNYWPMIWSSPISYFILGTRKLHMPKRDSFYFNCYLNTLFYEAQNTIWLICLDRFAKLAICKVNSRPTFM
jgi:hypothetical protein